MGYTNTWSSSIYILRDWTENGVTTRQLRMFFGSPAAFPLFLIYGMWAQK